MTSCKLKNLVLWTYQDLVNTILQLQEGLAYRFREEEGKIHNDEWMDDMCF